MTQVLSKMPVDVAADLVLSQVGVEDQLILGKGRMDQEKCLNCDNCLNCDSWDSNNVHGLNCDFCDLNDCYEIVYCLNSIVAVIKNPSSDRIRS